MSEFQGFAVPGQNWFKVPHEFISLMSKMNGSEIKVVLYVMRHTWGFSEYGRIKRITLDEFENGRKRKDGSRIDEGTGLSQPSIIGGLRKAVEHGYLVVESQGEDKARMKKLYGLRMTDETFTPDLKKFKCSSKEILDRTEKDTNRKKRNTLSEVDTSDASQVVANTSSEKSTPTIWDYRAADELSKVISSVVKVNGRMDRKSWANTFRIMRTRDKITKREIGEMIKWYAGHIGGQYDVQAFSAKSFRDKWEKLVAARIRNESNGSARTVSDAGKRTAIHKRKMQVCGCVLDWLREQGSIGHSSMIVSPQQVKRALTALDEDPKLITATFINSGGDEE